MNGTGSESSVTVGIDGSQPAIEAALWAIDEAAARGLPLRLICVTKAKHPSTDDYYADIRHAEDSLRAAQRAVEAAGASVKVETAIVTGPPAAALVAASDGAALICVGSNGIGRFARSVLGSTATELAEQARCPVAVIRPAGGPGREAVSWIVVADNQGPDTDATIDAALAEADLRQAPVLVVGRHGGVDSDVEALRERHPGLRIYPVGDGADVVGFLKKNDERVQLAVIGGAEADKLADILGPHGRHRFSHTESSVLVVRS